MMRFLAITLVVCAAVAAWFLPPDVNWVERGNRMEGERAPIQVEYEAAREHAAGLDDLHRRLEWLAEFHETSRRALEEGESFVVSIHEAHPSQSEAELRTKLMETFVSGSHGYRLGLFARARNHGARAPDLGSPVPTGSEYYIGRDAAGPYCFRLVTEWSPSRRPLDVKGLGVCDFYARFGSPGRAVADWLERGAHRFAAGAAGGATPRRLQDPPTIFGLWGLDRVHGSMIERCRSGQDAACEALFRDPLEGERRQRASRRAPVATYSPAWYFPVLDGPLLGYLLSQFGQDAVARFWTSTNPDLGVAFEEAFGTSVAEWTRELLRAQYGPVASPRIASLDLASTLLFLVLATGWALFAARRRAGPERDGLRGA